MSASLEICGNDLAGFGIFQTRIESDTLDRLRVKCGLPTRLNGESRIIVDLDQSLFSASPFVVES
ncbi:hypothetical protein ACVIGA_001200 [Bradyrhizobium sp. USDA 3240]